MVVEKVGMRPGAATILYGVHCPIRGSRQVLEAVVPIFLAAGYQNTMARHITAAKPWRDQQPAAILTGDEQICLA
jgi:hypothetical protein